MKIDVEFLHRHPPMVHLGGKHVWALSDDALSYIARTVNAGDVTVETGLGASTVLFAAIGCRHHCICPDEEQIALFRGYCRQHGIDAGNIEFYPNFSEDVVPAANFPALDLMLIDGGHGFPTPFIDWFYLARRLKVGGVAIVDDTQLWTGAVLRDFLLREACWSAVADDLGSRTSAFTLTQALAPQEWDAQPYVVDNSRRTRRSQLLDEVVRHVASGKFADLARKTARRLR